MDVGIAVLIALFMTLSALDQAGADRVDSVGYALLALGGLVLIAHRVWPLPVLVTAIAIQLLHYVRGYPEGAEWVATTVALGSLAWSMGWRRAAPFGVALVLMSMSDVLFGGAPGLTAEHALVMVGVTCAVSVGEWLRTREAYLVAVAERGEALAQVRADETRRLIGEERLRIAREVHDVVAHAIASISVQAGVGAHVGAREPERAREALVAIKHASSEALDDLRAVLDMLRLDGSGDGPVPSRLLELHRLVDQAHHAGLEVTVERCGTVRALPAPVDMAAYRIVQESLTNAMKHAVAGRVRINLEYRPDVLAVAVADSGGGPAPTGSETGGHGIQGMRERATALGGCLDAGITADGGFAVTAELPVRGQG